MPWDDILEELKNICSDQDLHELPRKGECLKYLMRVHLNIAGQDLEKHINGLRVRTFVLLKLLDFLIDSNHEAFRGKGSALDLKAKMRRLVEEEYPEEEGQLPEEQRLGTVPPKLLEVLQQQEQRRRANELQAWCGARDRNFSRPRIRLLARQAPA